MVGGKQGESGKRKNEIVSFFNTIIFTRVASQNRLLEWMSTTTSLAEMVIVSNLSVNKSESFDLLLFFIPYGKTSEFLI